MLRFLFCVVLIVRQYAWAIFLVLRSRSREFLSWRSSLQFVGLFPYFHATLLVYKLGLLCVLQTDSSIDVPREIDKVLGMRALRARLH